MTEDSVKESHEEAKEDEAAEGNAKKDTEQEPDEANGATKDADQPAEDDGVKEQ